MAANIDQISNGRFELNLVSAWWRDEMLKYTGSWLDHKDRYARSEEFLQVLSGMWQTTKENPFSFDGEHYQIKEALLSPKPLQSGRVPIYAGGESEQGRTMIAKHCSGYLMHGDSPEVIVSHISDMNQRRERNDLPKLNYGMAAYMICRETEKEAQDELKAITDVSSSPEARHSYEDFVSQSKLRSSISIEDYSVSNRGLRPGLVGTPEQILERIHAYENAGLEFMLIQASPMLEEIETIGQSIIPQL